MKKILAVLLVITLFLSTAGGVFAEEEQSGGFFDSIGSFFSEAWNDSTNWVTGAWGDASQWIEQAWGDSSGWVADIWGDVSSWVTDTYGDASGAVTAWWTDTFNKVTGNTKNAWEWLKNAVINYSDAGKELIEDIKTAIASAGKEAEEKIYAIFYKILLKFNLTETDADKVWSTIKAYAEQKGISFISAGKIALPYLLQLIEDQAAEGNESIPAIAISQYLTGVIEKNVESNQDAEKIIEKLSMILNEI